MPIEIARSRPGLKNLFDGFDDDIKGHFWEFSKLVESEFSLQVILAYSFFRLEQGQRTTLFCGARKLHKTDSDLTWKAIDGHYMSREHFQKFFETIFGVGIPSAVQDVIKPAETARDKIMHGQGIDDARIREAISRVLHYANQLNTFLDGRGVGFRAFVGDLRGFTGRLEALDKSTSRWILKGMGFQMA
jgi:hypothetical protein